MRQRERENERDRSDARVWALREEAGETMRCATVFLFKVRECVSIEKGGERRMCECLCERERVSERACVRN